MDNTIEDSNTATLKAACGLVGLGGLMCLTSGIYVGMNHGIENDLGYMNIAIPLITSGIEALVGSREKDSFWQYDSKKNSLSARIFIVGTMGLMANGAGYGMGHAIIDAVQDYHSIMP